MNIDSIDSLVNIAARLLNRRATLRTVGTAMFAAVVPGQFDSAAKKKRRKKRKKPPTVTCSDQCSAASSNCIVRPEGRHFCGNGAQTDCENCSTDQDCLATPDYPYCVTALINRATGQVTSPDIFCPDLIDGVCSSIQV